MKRKIWLDDDWIYLVIGNPALSTRINGSSRVVQLDAINRPRLI